MRDRVLKRNAVCVVARRQSVKVNQGTNCHMHREKELVAPADLLVLWNPMSISWCILSFSLFQSVLHKCRQGEHCYPLLASLRNDGGEERIK